MNYDHQKPQKPCLICGSQDWHFLYSAKDYLHDLEGEFSLWECGGCGFVHTMPQLVGEAIEFYYPEDYVAYSEDVSKEGNAIAKWDREHGVARRCDFAIKSTGQTTGKVLDVGCASGNFLKGMKDRGWQAFGVEPSAYASKYANEVLGLDVKHGYLVDGLFEDDFFDLVMLWDVFEHLEDPEKTLDVMYKIIKPGGTLLLSLPNSNSWDRAYFKEAWCGWDVPRHYYAYNPNLLQRLVERHGFKKKILRSFTGRHGSAALSFDYRHKIQGKTKAQRDHFQKFFNSYFFRILSYPFYFVSDRLNRSANMTMVFTKTAK